MLRRVTRALRFTLLGLGITGLIWTPLSFVVRAELTLPVDGLEFYCADGSLTTRLPDRPWGYNADWHPLIYRSSSSFLRFHGLVTIDWGTWSWAGGRGIDIGTPLWLLAIVCLAWPVTSFFLARRRQGRGFAVETTEGMRDEG